MEPQRLKAGHGWQWIKQGYALFMKSPLLWIVLLLILAAVSFLSVSFVVGVYLPWDGQNSNRKLPAISSIAVLPMRNLTGDAANDYLSDGLSEGMINEFSRRSKLKVISRSASFNFKNKEIFK